MTEIVAKMKWDVLTMEKQSVGDQQDVVFTVHWTLSGEQSAENIMHTGYTYGSVNIDYNPSGDFIPIEDLSKDNVLSWVWNVLDKTQHEVIVQTEINQKITPVTFNATPSSWSTSE